VLHSNKLFTTKRNYLYSMIEKYINELLITQDVVVVPNFGVFTATFSPASFSADGSLITPPRKVISFSIYINEEDKNDELMKIVMRGENKSYYDFNEQLLVFVQKAQQSIISTNAYHIEGLGTLFKDENNKIVLKQDNDAALLGDSFGLPSIATAMDFVEYKPTEDLKEYIDAPMSVEGKPTSSYEIAETTLPKEEIGRKKEETTPKTIVKDSNNAAEDKQEATKEGKKNELAWWLAVVPMVLLLASITYLFVFPEAMQNFKAFFGSSQEVSADLNTPKEENNETNPIDNITEEDTSRFGDEIVEKQVDDTPTKKQEETKPTNDTNLGDDGLSVGKFYLVYGSFSSKALASKASKPLEAQGLSIKIAPIVSKGLFRVLIGDFDSHADATNKKAALGSAFSQTWVLKAE
jgi:cell division protein FtsN